MRRIYLIPWPMQAIIDRKFTDRATPEGSAFKHQAVPSTSSHTVLIPRTTMTIPYTGEREVRKEGNHSTLSELTSGRSTVLGYTCNRSNGTWHWVTGTEKVHQNAGLHKAT